jgi:hypothetical protein
MTFDLSSRLTMMMREDGGGGGGGGGGGTLEEQVRMEPWQGLVNEHRATSQQPAR